MSRLLGADVRQPLAQTAHGESAYALKQETENRVGQPPNAHELEASFVGDACTTVARDEGDLVGRSKGRVTSAEDQERRSFELDDPVFERDPSSERGDRHLEAAAEPDLAAREPACVVDARIPLGGPAEVGEVVEGLLDEMRRSIAST